MRYDWLVALTNLLGIVLPTSTVLFLGFLFVFFVEVQAAHALTKQHNQIQELVQEVGLLTLELKKIKESLNATPSSIH